ncbi:hypothetical protein KBD11_00475 [Candidatus Saccharibacteria bacterium]|nr:hypothetical protein [Candidatus Saccharibacteria bacterium]
MDAFEIIVVVLSVLLGIFLVIAIIVTVLVLKLVKTLRDVATKSGDMVGRVEELGQSLVKNAGAVGLLKVLVKFIATASKAKGRR